MPNELTGTEVQHIAELARLNVSAEEEARLAGELNSILEFVGQLGQVDTAGVEPLAHPTGDGQLARQDEAHPSGLNIDDLLASAPAREGRCVKVRAVFSAESPDAS